MRANYPKGSGAQNMSGMLKQAQKMQEDMAALQAELETREYEAVAGGGMVTVKINGKREILNIDIKPEIQPQSMRQLKKWIPQARVKWRKLPAICLCPECSERRGT